MSIKRCSKTVTKYLKIQISVDIHILFVYVEESAPSFSGFKSLRMDWEFTVLTRLIYFKNITCFCVLKCGLQRRARSYKTYQAVGSSEAAQHSDRNGRLTGLHQLQRRATTPAYQSQVQHHHCLTVTVAEKGL